MACNWVANEVLASLKDRNVLIDEFPLTVDRLSGLVAEVMKTGLPMKKAQVVQMLEHGDDVAAR